jgi:DNA polymerase III sliding clamp (beta) subunit (PCNA family)
MDLEDLKASATPAEMAAALDEHKDVLHGLQHAHTREPSVREEAYRGHRIKVVTTKLRSTISPWQATSISATMARFTTTLFPIRSSHQ